MDENGTTLQDEDEWDFGAAVRQRPPRGRRAVVSVGFKTEDFSRVAAAARQRDVPVSQFIRQAALDRARRQPTGVGDGRCIAVVASQKVSDLLGEWETTKQKGSVRSVLRRLRGMSGGHVISRPPRPEVDRDHESRLSLPSR